MPSNATTPEQYIAELPADRQAAVTELRKTITQHLPQGYEEAMAWGMICYQVPLSAYPDTYNGQPLMYAAIASNKNYISVYLCNVYADDALRQKFIDQYTKTGKKPDMGKSCLRFKNPADIPLDVVGEAIAATPMADYVAMAKAARGK